MLSILVPANGASDENVLFHSLVEIILIILAAQGCGRLAKYLGQPQVVGEMAAGIFLGPTLLGWALPDLFHYLFTSSPTLPLSILSQIGLILLMFQIGMEFDFSHLRSRDNRRVVSFIWLTGILFPAALGAGLGGISHSFFSPAVPLPTYVLFMAVSLCITAMPVLGRIMLELNLTRTRLGTLTITCAAFDDVAGWLLLAVVTALAQTNSHGSWVLLRLSGLAVFMGITWRWLRPSLIRLVRQTAQKNDLSRLGLLLSVLFTLGLITQSIGIHAIFGGFWLGVLLHTETDFVAWWRERASGFITVLFLPIFFTFTGLRTNISGLISPELWAWCFGVVALACLGKFGGCWLAARWAGLPAAEARCVAIMMNTRGLLELVVANVGYDLKIIPQPLFTMLVVMALFSTALTTPCLRAWLPTDHRPTP